MMLFLLVSKYTEDKSLNCFKNLLVMGKALYSIQTLVLFISSRLYE